MKNKIIIIAFLSLLSNTIVAQTDDSRNPKKKWFFGAEVGLNTIISNNPNPTNSIQGGLLAEYYFAKHWAVMGRIKYLETGVSNRNDAAKGVFEGAIISVPLNIIWDYTISKKVRGNVKLGIAFNQEIKSNYYYPANQSTNYSTFYASFNPGIGFSYLISTKTIVFMNYEVYVLGNDRDDSDWFQKVPNSPNNSIVNVGIKHNFKKSK